jgi:fructokinase
MAFPGRLTEMVARRWLGLGASIVVITLAERGAIAFSSAGSSEWPAASIPVVDTVGAGDSFTAAALQHLLRQGYAGPSDRTTLGSIDSDGLAALLASGLSAAAITCSRPGAQPPTLAELSASPSG